MERPIATLNRISRLERVQVAHNVLVAQLSQEPYLFELQVRLLLTEAGHVDALIDGFAPVGVLQQIDHTELAAAYCETRLEALPAIGTGFRFRHFFLRALF